jgi:hypothetical protein
VDKEDDENVFPSNSTDFGNVTHDVDPFSNPGHLKCREVRMSSVVRSPHCPTTFV